MLWPTSYPIDPAVGYNPRLEIYSIGYISIRYSIVLNKTPIRAPGALVLAITDLRAKY